MKKRIIIAGGGISGLSLLHYLRQEYKDQADVSIQLLEEKPSPGGTINSVARDGYLFEEGPNGFLDSKPRTLELIRELSLDSELVKAEDNAANRFVVYQHKLYPIPDSPRKFFQTPLLNPIEKFRVLSEPWIRPRQISGETVFEFGCRRLGKKFTEVFLDAFVTGVFAGDSKRLHLASAFPRIHQLEQEYGSLFKAMLSLKKKGGSPRGVLRSFRMGMSTIIRRLAESYASNIVTDARVEKLIKSESEYKVITGKQEYTADIFISAMPAHSLAPLLRDVNPYVGKELAMIDYVPVVVVGLGFNVTKQSSGLPKGFGYLIPSREKSKVLGVLFESCVFDGRATEGKFFARVLIGGARFRKVLDLSDQELIHLAKEEILWHFPAFGEPINVFIKRCEKAIPQYDPEHQNRLNQISVELKKSPQLYLHGNYLRGIAFNDCIENSYRLAAEIVSS